MIVKCHALVRYCKKYSERALYGELTTLVPRILKTHVPVFAGLHAAWPISNQYSVRSVSKSEIVRTTSIII